MNFDFPGVEVFALSFLPAASMMFSAFFLAAFLSGLEPEVNPALIAPERMGFSLKLPDPAPTENAWDGLGASLPAMDWPQCSLPDAATARIQAFVASLDSIKPQGSLPDSTAAFSQKPAGTSSQPLDERARFVGLIPEGSLVKFEDQESSVIFRSAQTVKSSHRPGPLEDEVIASAVRGRIAADMGLQKLKLAVESQSGKVRITGSAESTIQTAALIKLALGVDGVEEVKVDLPADLRAASK